ncbi:MAG: tRNA (guanine-N1)-methyltransferase [Flavobacteriaceae bacterium]
MNRTLSILLFFILVGNGYLHAQDHSLEDQFTDVIDKSNRYEDYKVVKIYKLNELRKNVIDSIAKLENEVDQLQATVSTKQSSIDSLTQKITTTAEALALSQKKEDGISFFGSIIKKSTYQTIMWSIIGLLILTALFFLYKFKNSNAITREANKKLMDTETEYEDHRRMALEREQQLRRKLQDEINKQKKA